MIIHSGRLPRQAERLDDLEALDDAQRASGRCSLQLSSAVSSLDSSSRSSSASSSLMASAPMPASEIVLVLFAHVAVLALGEDLLLHERRIARIDNDIVGEVQHLLEDARADMSRIRPMRDGMPLKYQMCDTGAASSMWPMRSRRTLALVTSTPHLSQILPLIADLLVLAAVALPVLGRAKDTLAEQAVAFRLERAVVDGFGLFNFAVGPFADQVRGRQTDLDGVKRIDIPYIIKMLLPYSQMIFGLMRLIRPDRRNHLRHRLRLRRGYPVQRDRCRRPRRR